PRARPAQRGRAEQPAAERGARRPVRRGAARRLALKIHAGCLVELEYELRDAEGGVVEKSEQDGPMVYLHGNDEIPTPLERELEGREKGDVLEVSLPPGAAYGEYNPDGLVTVPREQFPPDAEIVPGDWIDVTLSDDEGQEPENADSIEMKVVEISPEA